MRNTFTFFIIIIFCYACSNPPERNCSDFRTGTFEFEYTIDDETKIGKFVRTDAYNIDFYEGKVDSAAIRWINDCEFVVKKIHPKKMSEKKAIHMKILTTDNDSYTFEYNLVGDTKNKMRGNAKKIKN